MATAEVSMEICLMVNMPYEIVFEIFRRLPKDTLYVISKLCQKFRDIAGDTRLWKNLYIEYYNSDYDYNDKPSYKIFAFEELYSEPWSVKALDLSRTQINSPVSSHPDQVITVTKLILSSITGDEVAMEAILTKYQCTELYFNCEIGLDSENRCMKIAPEVFSKQTALEELCISDISALHFDIEEKTRPQWLIWLTQVLSNCKNLKTLNLNCTHLCNPEMLGFGKNLPATLEKLFLAHAEPEASFFELLAERTPNLRELMLRPTSVKCPYLLKFQFLEALVFSPLYYGEDYNYMCTYLTKFPALKTIYEPSQDFPKKGFEKLRTTLESHGIIFREMEDYEWPSPDKYNLWQVSKAV